MPKVYVKVTKTLEGKFVGQVRTYTDIMYETAEYVTVRMAQADAECWEAFHVSNDEIAESTATGTFEILSDDVVYSRSGNTITGKEFTEKLRKILENAERRGAEVKFGVHKVNDGRRGFHLDIKVGNSPVRKFTIHRSEG